MEDPPPPCEASWPLALLHAINSIQDHFSQCLLYNLNPVLVLVFTRWPNLPALGKVVSLT